MRCQVYFHACEKHVCLQLGYAVSPVAQANAEDDEGCPVRSLALATTSTEQRMDKTFNVPRTCEMVVKVR